MAKFKSADTSTEDPKMLQIRPNCEWCDAELPPNSDAAQICSYECTYCASCVQNVLHNVCPTCGGGFAPRPIRPMIAYRNAPKLGLANQPASQIRVHSKYSKDDVAQMVKRLKDVPSGQR
jgi:hypothetical protein